LPAQFVPHVLAKTQERKSERKPERNKGFGIIHVTKQNCSCAEPKFNLLQFDFCCGFSFWGTAFLGRKHRPLLCLKLYLSR
ncbi:MAG: hypothetical protein KA511_00350, partial [Brachymonas sp.]|nr:hypothetical protein [Brachymonas sp.]MBP6966490.1 hypothetical protein [Brachymonas sp.]